MSETSLLNAGFFLLLCHCNVLYKKFNCSRSLAKHHVSRSIEIFTVLISPHVQDGQIKQGAAQPMYLQTDLKSFDLSGLGVKFDVMLVEPPLEEYQRRASGVNFSWSPWEWEEVRRGGGEDGRREGLRGKTGRGECGGSVYSLTSVQRDLPSKLDTHVACPLLCGRLCY